MKIKEVQKLTQQSVTDILGNVTELCSEIISSLGQEVSTKLNAAGIIASDIEGLNELFESTSCYCQPFEGLTTYYRQVAFYKEHFNLVVSA